MSVADNVGYGLRISKVPRQERERRTTEALEMVRLPNLGGRMPAQLSGGQRQRVALARAIVNRPQGAAARRAARRARPQAPPGDAGRAQADPAGGRDHVRLRDARPGGGAHDERPPGRVQPRPDRADRRARRGLRAPAERVHRGLRRRLERARARRPAVHDPAGEDPPAGRSRATASTPRPAWCGTSPMSAWSRAISSTSSTAASCRSCGRTLRPRRRRPSSEQGRRVIGGLERGAHVRDP